MSGQGFTQTIDWLAFTVPDASIEDVCEVIGGEWFESETGFRGYPVYLIYNRRDGREGWERRDWRGDQLPDDRMGCGLDSRENLRLAFGVEFVSIEAEKEAFANGFRGGLWVLFQNGRFDQDTHFAGTREE